MAEVPDETSSEVFLERFSSAMVASGMPRMPSRVFAWLLTREDGAGTAAELAEALQASPAAISGAVRYLIQVRLITRSHRPGDRKDVYRLVSDRWYEMLGHREHELRLWAELSREGESVIGTETAAGRRLGETARFFEFLIGEMAAMLERWRQLPSD